MPVKFNTHSVLVLLTLQFFLNVSYNEGDDKSEPRSHDTCFRDFMRVVKLYTAVHCKMFVKL